jgi:hypothetical protein
LVYLKLGIIQQEKKKQFEAYLGSIFKRSFQTSSNLQKGAELEQVYA